MFYLRNEINFVKQSIYLNVLQFEITIICLYVAKCMYLNVCQVNSTTHLYFLCRKKQLFCLCYQFLESEEILSRTKCSFNYQLHFISFSKVMFLFCAFDGSKNVSQNVREYLLKFHTMKVERMQERIQKYCFGYGSEYKINLKETLVLVLAIGFLTFCFGTKYEISQITIHN